MGRRKQFVGIVVGDKMQKTIIVKVSQRTKHPKYNRVIKVTKKFKVHDEKESANLQDTVRIEETRPLSKDKFFRLVEVIKKSEAPTAEVKEEAQ